jgi:hypothetical protein
MRLRQRIAITEKYDEMETSEVSSEVDSDDGDNWVVSKNRKNKPKKRKRINSRALQNSSKKKHTLEKVENAQQSFACNLNCISHMCHILLFCLCPS